jgi:hypothetical protein
MSALSSLGSALGNKLDQRSAMKKAGKMYDSPIPQIKRPFEVGPPFETNA